jgi:hypothetical protein
VTKKLKYFFRNKLIQDSIVPAKKMIPQWYKDISPADFKKDGTHKNVKSCIPFLDSFSIGYLLTLPQDVYVLPNEDYTSISIDYNLKDQGIVEVKTRKGESIPFPENFYEIEFIWLLQHCLKLPKGYSAIVTHPFNRHDLPFMSLTGIVDADGGIQRGNFPFYIKKGFEGKIPMGTPFAQIIPFKRENWKAEFDEELSEIDETYTFFSNRVTSGWYKNNIWKRKNFD